MFQDIAKLTKHSAVFGLGNLLERFLSFILLPIYVIFLSDPERGAFYIIYATIVFLNIFYTWGTDTAFLRFFLAVRSEKDKKEYFATAFIAAVITALTFSTLIFLFADLIGQNIAKGGIPAPLIVLGGGILLFDALSLFGFLVLRAEEESKKFVILKIVKASLILIANVVLVIVLGLKVKGALIANIVGSAVSFLTVIPVYLKYFRFAFNLEKYKELIKFGIPYIFTTISFVVMDQIDKYFLDRMESIATVGIYGVVNQISRIMRLFVAAFGFAWQPFFMSISHKPDCKEVYARVLTYFSFIGLWLFLFTVFFMNDIILLLNEAIVYFLPGFPVPSPDGVNSALTILPYILLAYFFYGIYINISVGVFIKKKPLYLAAVVGIAAGVNIIGNLLLIPHYGMAGAAISTLISYFVMVVILYVSMRGVYHIQYEWRRLAKIGFAAAITYTVTKIGINQGPIVLEIAAFIFFPILLYAMRFYQDLELKRAKQIVRAIFRS